MMRSVRTGLFIGLIIGLTACAAGPVSNGAERGVYVGGDIGRSSR